MTEGSGQLLIRDADEPYALESPTTYAGTIDGGDEATGAISGASFATPDISFQVPVLDGALMANVDAHFEEIAPGTATGLVTPEGEVVLTTSLRVDLNIVVPEVAIDADCSTSPVNIELVSSAPYDIAAERVTVVDADFSIPSFPTTEECPSLVADNLNPLLAGPGHRLDLTLQGAIDPPPAPGSASETTLTAIPEGASRFGEGVILRAEVASDDPQNTMVPTGTVRFAVDGEPVGTVVLAGGIAELTTSDLTAGSHTITASYGGDSEFEPSQAEIPYTVDAVPAVDIDLPPTVVIDEAPQELTLTVENSSLGVPVENAAVDVTMTRPAGGFFRPGMIVLERRVSGDTWEEVALSIVSTSVISGRLGPDVGRLLPAPGSLVDDLRIRANPTGSGQDTPLGPVTVELDLQRVDPATGAVAETLSTSSGSVMIAQADRQTASILIDEGSFGPPILPFIVRAGNSIQVNGWGLNTGGIPATGTISVLLDGLPVPFWHKGLANDDPDTMEVAPSGMGDIVVDTPPTLQQGSHTLTVRYSGDPLLTPASASRTFTVVEQRDPLYDCIMEASPPRRFRAQVRATARVPVSARAGQEISLRNLDVEFVTDRSFGLYQAFLGFIDESPGSSTVGDMLDLIEFELGEGTATAISVTQSGSFQFEPSDSNPDMRFTFDGEAGTVPVDGLPGDAVPIDLDRIHIVGRNFFGAQADISCVPVADPVRVGTVTVAGTTLAVEAPQPTRADDLVRLRATVAPSNATGQVEFLDGDEVISIASVVGGQAVAATVLAEGSHELTARLRAGASAPSTTSDPVTVDVLPALECAAFAEAGNGAVVRLVYLELLLRCPEPAGYDFWVGQLDDGTPADSFARAIAYTDEALGQVVDDAYRTMLERDAETAGREFWIDRLKGMGRYDQLLAHLGSSPEFFALAGSSNTGFVERVYRTILERPADPDGSLYWRVRLAGGEPRAAMVRTFARLSEPLGVVVEASYDEILGRAPTSGERQAAIDALRADGDRSALYSDLVGTSEFFTRAQAYPNPED